MKLITLPVIYLFQETLARISVGLQNSQGTQVEAFTCSGVMRGRNLATSVGDYVKQTINITQASTQGTNVYVASMIDSYVD